MLADVFFPDTIGGAGRVAYHLCSELSRKGYDVHVITRNRDRKLPSHQRLNTNLSVHRFLAPQEESLCLILLEIKNSYSMAKQIAREMKFDLVCIHQSLAAIGPLLSGCFKDIPIFYYYHSPWHKEFLIKKQKGSGGKGPKVRAIAFIMRWIEKQILTKAARVIVLSQYMLKELSGIHDYPEKKIVKIPGGVDLNRFHLPDGGKAKARTAVKLPQKKTIFLTVRNSSFFL